MEMKKWTVALGICTLLVCSTLTITVAASEQPTVYLPSGAVLMTPDYDGSASWFNFTLSGVPLGYDVKNGVYPGWCVQKYKEMASGTNNPVVLKSCYADNLPLHYQEIDWEKINYIINHKQGKNRVSVQYAIWNFTDHINYSTYPGAQAIINDTNANSSGYIPQSGEILAIPIDGTAKGTVDVLQLAFLELIIPVRSDFEGVVWYDSNANGLRENEPGIQDVTVRLYSNNNTLIQNTTTDSSGKYSYTNVTPGDYYLQFTLLTGYTFSPRDAGDDTLDSDADTTTGKTINFTIAANQNITIWDAGMYIQSSGGTPKPHEETPSNYPPTADASAGEPYQGYINSSITFNGSRSYDYDGRIITWRWSFGDGANGTGEITPHMYTLPGNYTVTLNVTDNKFVTDLYTTTARITLGNNPPSTPVVSGPLSGHMTLSYQYTIVSTDPDGDNLRYIIDWGDSVQNTSLPIESGNNIQTIHQWNAAGFYVVQAYARDPYNATSEIYEMVIAIDVKYVGDMGYLIDENGDGIFDKFHSNATGIETGVSQQTNGQYLIDSNGDGTWDVAYDAASGQTQDYHEQPLFQYAIILLVILLIAFILILYLVRNRRRSRTLRKNQNDKDHSDNKRP